MQSRDFVYDSFSQGLQILLRSIKAVLIGVGVSFGLFAMLVGIVVLVCFQFGFMRFLTLEGWKHFLVFPFPLLVLVLIIGWLWIKLNWNYNSLSNVRLQNDTWHTPLHLIGVAFGALITFIINYVVGSIGLALLIVPGVYWLVRTNFIWYALADGFGPIGAIKHSWQLTKDNVLPVFLLWFLSYLVLAVLPLFGALWMLFANAVAYDALRQQNHTQKGI